MWSGHYREQNISCPCQDQTFIPLLSSPLPTLTELWLFSLLKVIWNYHNCENRTNSLYAFFWVIPWCLNFICRCLRTLCLFHLHRRVGMKNSWYLPTSSPKNPDHLWGTPMGGETAKPWSWQLISIQCSGKDCEELNFHSPVCLQGGAN